MKALVYTAPETLAYRDVADPVAADGEVMVRVDSVGICGSDLHAFLGHDERRPAPLILGHEVSGTLTSGPNSGQRVTVNPLVTCGHCKACVSGRDNLCPDRQIISMQPREGGFAEQLAMPERNLVALPDTISTDKAALAEPIACGWHAVRLGKALIVNPSQANALVMGGGAIGLGAALSLKAQGISDILIVEPNAERRTYLNEQCGQNSIAPDQLSATQMFDIIVDGVGIEASRSQASAHAKPGGVIVHIGLGSAAGGLDIRRMTLQEITFIGTYTYTAQDFRDTTQAMFEGRLGTLDWTDNWPLEDGQAAFQAIRAGTVPAPKILLKQIIEETSMSEIPHLLVHEQADNVGVVVVEGLTAGTDMLCCITHDNSTFRLTAKHDVPIGHKIALKDLKTGDTCMKYGEDIGKIVADVAQGEHLHTHNCKTKRW